MALSGLFPAYHLTGGFQKALTPACFFRPSGSESELRDSAGVLAGSSLVDLTDFTSSNPEKASLHYRQQ